MPFRNALSSQCLVIRDLGCWISGIRKTELSLRAARCDKKSQATSWTFLATPPTFGGPK